jgi:MoaA/NifB/PqqE/SkfB family radical SAM enzyme
MDKFKINLQYAFRLHKPVLVLRLIIRMIQVHIFKRKNLLRYVDFAIGYKCNITCEHCFAKDLIDNSRGRMPVSRFAEVVKNAMKLGVVNFSFQGGEPLIYKDLYEYIKAAKPWANLISITTNGTLLTYDKCVQLRKIGVDIITLSVDPYRKNTDWKEKVKNAKKAGMNVTLGTVVTNTDIKDFFNEKNQQLDTLIYYAQKHKIILMLIFAVPMGGFESDDSVLLTNRNAFLLRELIKDYSYIRTDFDANYKEFGCGAGKEIIFINPYGDVYACPFINIPFGNLRYSTLKKIRENILCHEIFKTYHPTCIAGEGKGIREKF